MKIKRIILLVSLSTVLACEKDLLDTVPNDRILEEQFWQSESDIKLAANGIYTYLDGTEIFFWTALSDIARPNVPFSNAGVIQQGQIDPMNEDVHNEWSDAYEGIRAANYFLRNLENAEVTNNELVADLEAEVRFLRAYQYVKLAALFGDVPLIVDVLSIEEGKNVEETAVEEVWDFVEQELELAANELPVDAIQEGRITKGAALALMSRAMLYAQRYEKAANAALRVMELGKYELYPSYEKLFSYGAENNVEVILDKQFLTDQYSNNVFNLLAPRSQRSASSAFVPVKKMIDAYEMTSGENIEDAATFDPFNPYDNRDPRLDYSNFVLGDTLPDGTIYDSRPGSGTVDAVDHSYQSTITGWNIEKYINEEDLDDPSNSGINIILIRFAEVLLNYAEAKIEMGEIDQSVYDAINRIRQRPDVDMPPIEEGLSQSELREVVRHERMVELAYEGLRFFDLRRWKIAEDVLVGPTSGMTYEQDGELITLQQESFIRAFNPARDYLWPIPQKELDLNENLSQNPGW